MIVPANFSETIDRWLNNVHDITDDIYVGPELQHKGKVEKIGDGVAMISGLSKTKLNELVVFDTGVHGLALSIDNGLLGCILLGPVEGISAGSDVSGSGLVARTKVGESLLGRVTDPLGNVLDGGAQFTQVVSRNIDQAAPAVLDRELVTEPLLTGITVIDAMLPIGRGQRELIIGDRGTGKTAIAVDTMISQKETDVICIYAAVGQKSSTISSVIEAVKRYGKMENSIFVAAFADSSPGAQWLAPYSACSIAEYFMEQGRDVLLVIDDMTKHAATYRELALLLGYPPGREAFPSDIFYIHARLLERAARLNASKGGGSLTVLPIVETQAGNLSAYIPTNLISITDGQIYLEPKLFNEGLKPAVDVGRSVSRVGGKTQVDVLRKLVSSLKIDYAQFQELEIFTRFSTATDENTLKIIKHGRRIRSVLGQEQYKPLRFAEQFALLFALKEDILDQLSLDDVALFKRGIGGWVSEHATILINRIVESGEIVIADREALCEMLRQYAAQFHSYKEDDVATPRH
tara:strand:- start:7666 stop:9225 length:1560 start_codon:yes stop_codon:yes gene_type:complete